jgi:hypothetical protein
MERVRAWEKKLSLLLLAFLQLIIISRRVFANSVLEGGNNVLLSGTAKQDCENPQRYFRGISQASIDVYSNPNGRAIGLIPSGWAVIVVGRDSSGRWARITSHFGDDVGTHSRFISAPLFRPGWVISSSLEDLGLHCEKPISSISINLQAKSNFLQVQEDWLQLGDRIAMVGEE